MSFWKKLGKSIKKNWRNPTHMFEKFYDSTVTGIEQLGQGMEAWSQGDIAGGIKKQVGGETTSEKTVRQQKEATEKANRLNASNQKVIKGVARANQTEEMESANIMAKFGTNQTTETPGSATGGVQDYLTVGSGDSLAMRIAKQKKKNQ